MNKSKKLVFFGNERLATGVSTNTPVLKALVSGGYDIAAVISNFTEPSSRNARQLEIAAAAQDYLLPFLTPAKLNDIYQQLKSYKAEAGVLVAYGRIVPQEIIDIFPNGIVNLHPSLLPVYRGSTPIETAILDGTVQTGVSLMKLVKEMDAGPVYDQEKLSLSGTESKQELADRLSELGLKMLLHKLPSILDGTLEPKAQNESLASYTKLISKADGEIDLSKPAERIEREIRAYSGWPKSRTNLYGHDVIITRARLINDDSEGDLVLSANPGFLQITELIAPSGRAMSGSEFLRGYFKRG